MLALLVLVTAAQAPLPSLPTPGPDAGVAEADAASAPQAPAPPVALRVGLETGFTLWPEGAPFDLLAVVRPLVSLQASDAFELEAGATLNLLAVDNAPPNRELELFGLLRRADWDEPSDFGQLLRRLRAGKEGGPLWLRAGPVRLKTLGPGHLVNRYSNQDAPNYHPAAAAAGFAIGPARGELFASDVLGPRLFAGLAGVELGRLFAVGPAWHDRFWLTAELAHDVGQAGGAECSARAELPQCPAGLRRASPSLTAAHLDFSAQVVRSASLRLQALLGVGWRLGPRVDWGAVAGLAADAELGPMQLGVKLEARKQAGGFRHGLFGPQYELSRFAGAGFSGVPLAEQVLPDGGSVYGELKVGRGGRFVAELSVEHFFFGRTELDASLQAELLEGHLSVAARFTAVALGVFPRYALGVEARVRVVRSLYVIASSGTVFFPQPDASLVRGVFFTGGVGVDFELLRSR